MCQRRPLQHALQQKSARWLWGCQFIGSRVGDSRGPLGDLLGSSVGNELGSLLSLSVGERLWATMLTFLVQAEA